uniref:hypothetical protein n=1 Tax=Gormaniella terricola TaxID=2904618 RepID=UPI0021CD1664|nr:hypothetical protein ODF01_pgp069 [Gormaniella terricola]UWV18234.1 hypothetical protein [Gormaniella terricola]
MTNGNYRAPVAKREINYADIQFFQEASYHVFNLSAGKKKTGILFTDYWLPRFFMGLGGLLLSPFVSLLCDSISESLFPWIITLYILSSPSTRKQKRVRISRALNELVQIQKEFEEKKQKQEEKKEENTVSYFVNFRLNTDFLYLGSLFFETAVGYPFPFSQELFSLYVKMIVNFLDPLVGLSKNDLQECPMEPNLKFNTNVEEIAFQFQNAKQFKSYIDFLEKKMNKLGHFKKKRKILVNNQNFYCSFFETENIFFSSPRNKKKEFLLVFADFCSFQKWGIDFLVYSEKNQLTLGKDFNCYSIKMGVLTTGFSFKSYQEVLKSFKHYLKMVNSQLYPALRMLAGFSPEFSHTLQLTSANDPNIGLELKLIPRFLSRKKYGVFSVYTISKCLGNFFFEDINDQIIHSINVKKNLGKNALKKSFQNAFIKTHSEIEHLFLGMGIIRNLTILWKYGHIP